MDLSHLNRGATRLEATGQLPSSFDWRDFGKVSPVKHQDGCGTCWDFGTTSVLESAVLMGEDVEYDFSEQSVALCVDPAWVYYYDGEDDPCPAGGWSWLASESFIRKGAVLESCSPYEPEALKCDGSCPGCDACPPVKRVNGYRFVTGDQGATELIKQAVYEHGPTTMSFLWSGGHVYEDAETYGTVYDYTACQPGVEFANHLVSIIGWDDEVPHYEAPGQGAWLVKNSWGEGWGNDGTFWLAYDSSCMTEIAYLTYEDYDAGAELLHWDEAGFVGSHGYGDTSAWVTNVFTAQRDSTLTHVEFWTTDHNTDYAITVYRDGDPTDGLTDQVTARAGTCGEAGYYSVALDDPVPLSAGQAFAIAVQMTTEVYTAPIAIEEAAEIKTPPTGASASDGDGELGVVPPIQRGVSFARHGESDRWTDLADEGKNACLRARTKAYAAFHYVETLGVTEEAYFEDAEHLNYPYGVGVDGDGNLWVGEMRGARALKYTGSGAHLMSIGTAGLIGRADETHFYGVADVAVGDGGDIWVVDTNPDRVVRYDAAGEFLMQLGETWADGPENDQFAGPRSVAFDSAGDVYVSDSDNHRIQVFDSSGAYSTTIGVTGEAGSDDDHLDTPRHIAIDDGDNLYVADAGNHRVQIFDAVHQYTATLGVPGEWGWDEDHLNWPMGVAVDGDHIYVADLYNHRVQIFDRATRAYQTTLGTGSAGSGNDAFYWPADVAVDTAGNLYVADGANFRVQKFSSSLRASRTAPQYAPRGSWFGSLDPDPDPRLLPGSPDPGREESAHPSLVYERTFGTTGVPYLTDSYHLNEPADVAVDASGNVAVVEGEGGGNRLITLGADGVPGFSVGEPGVWGTGDAHFDEPRGVAFDADGDIYVADTVNNRVQIFNADGSYRATLGTGWGSGDYEFKSPQGVEVDADGTVYVADSDNHRVQIYDGSLTYVATLGVAEEAGSDNEHLEWPLDVAVGEDGDIYVADGRNHRVQRYRSDGTYHHTLGTTGEPGDDFAHFDEPSGVALDAAGNVYVADRFNDRVQVFNSSGAYLTTIGGDSGSEVGRFREPTGVAVDGEGNVTIADHHNHRGQKYAPGVPGWEPVNVNGFGDRDNVGAWALGAFDGELYVSTVNYGGTEVYRLASGAWEQVVDGGFGHGANVAVDWFAGFDGDLYVGTWNGSSSGQVWRSATGDRDSWEQVVGDGFGDSANSEVMVLAPFGGTLYAGTWSYDAEDHGAEIWRSPTGDGGSWTRVAGDTVFGGGDNQAILSFAVFGDHLYAATFNDHSGGEVWRTGDGIAWTQTNADGFGNPYNGRVVSLEVFDGQLYAGTHNHEIGGEIWRTSNGADWSRVVEGGFDGVDNRRIASLAAFDGDLYAVVGNFETGPEVWRSSTGDQGSWKKVTDTGFGGGRSNTLYWDAAVVVLGDSLYVGTTTSGNGGGRVWRRVAAPEPQFRAGITTSVAPVGQVDYGDALTYTLVISAVSGTEMTLYDPLLGTSFDRFLEQPEGVEHTDGAITGTVAVTPANQITVSFVVEVDVPALPGLTGSVTNKACVRPVGGTLADCVWSNDVANTLSREAAASSCLPHYGEPEFVLRANETSPIEHEPVLTAGDFNADGLDDVVITRLTFQTYQTYTLDILLNDGTGNLVLATSGVFSGTVPAVQNPKDVLQADFNGDGATDFLVIDHGYDAPPHPGYRNTLVLSVPGGRLIDASGNLPQQSDFTHSAAVGDVDRDGDTDLYLGQFWGQSGIDPQLLINDGAGAFAVAEGRLHHSLSLNHNGYTSAALVDLDNDGYPDLVLGDAGDEISNEYSTPDSVVLLNDGSGSFASTPIPLPPKPFAATDIGLHIQTLDVDRDGYMDLLMGYTKGVPSYVGTAVQVLINNQDGSFRDETGARLPQQVTDDRWIRGMQLLDLDDDQDLDLIVRLEYWPEPDPLLFLNDGSGYFSQQPLHFGLPYLYYDFLDLDGDGGHDLVYATSAPPEDIYVVRDLGCPVFLPMVCRQR
jgi:C1A family cysteine protease